MKERLIFGLWQSSLARTPILAIPPFVNNKHLMKPSIQAEKSQARSPKPHLIASLVAGSPRSTDPNPLGLLRSPASSALYGSNNWVVAKELSLSYYIGETIQITIYAHSSNLN